MTKQSQYYILEKAQDLLDVLHDHAHGRGRGHGLAQDLDVQEDWLAILCSILASELSRI